MYQQYRSGKPLFAILSVVGLSVLLGGCVGDRLVPPGIAGRMAPRELCATGKGENVMLGFPDGAIMSLVGVYESSSGDFEPQVVRAPRDPYLRGCERSLRAGCSSTRLSR